MFSWENTAQPRALDWSGWRGANVLGIPSQDKATPDKTGQDLIRDQILICKGGRGKKELGRVQLERDMAAK